MLRFGLGLVVLLAGLSKSALVKTQVFVFSFCEFQEEGSFLLQEAAMQLSSTQRVAGYHASLPGAEVLAGKQAEDSEGHGGRGGQRGRGQDQQHQDGALHGCVN